ncbi:MAG: universal stress protein [Hyphomicrobiaceae bacterium]
MYKKIVVPVDLAHTDKAPTMIEAAKKLADDNAQIILTNIVDEIPGHIAAQLPGGHSDRAKSTALEKLQGIAKTSGFDIEIDVRVGQPARAILAVAENHDADAIVIASHRPGLQDYLLGSTAARVVRHATCTVVVIR